MLHFALQKLHLLPSQVLSLPPSELAFVYASIIIRAKREKEQADKVNHS